MYNSGLERDLHCHNASIMIKVNFWTNFGKFWLFFWHIRLTGNSANAFSSDLNSVCCNEVQTSNLEDPFLVIIWQFFGHIWLYLAIFGYFFGMLGFLVTLPMHFPVILTQFVAMRCKQATLKTHFCHYLAIFWPYLALFGHFWPFFWFIRFSGNPANAFSSDLNSICRNEVQTSRFEDAKRGR